jgi:hypothetical protein
MSDDEIVLDVTKEDGTVEQERVQRDATELVCVFLFSFRRRLTRRPFAAAGWSTTRRRVRQHRAADARDQALGAPLCCFRVVALTPSPPALDNAFTEIPAGVLVMTQLTFLNVSRRRRFARC